MLRFGVFDQPWDADRLRLNEKSQWILEMGFIANPRSTAPVAPTLLRLMHVALLEFWGRCVGYSN